MALDAATIALLAGELDEQLQASRITKITQPTKDEVLFTMHNRQSTFGLFVSARSGGARACLTNSTFENPAVPPSFCMLLRKYVTGGRFVRVRHIVGERILFFDFECTTQLRDVVTLTLAAELMGRYSNLVLIGEDERVIDALKRVDAEASSLRQLLPGVKYTLPPAQGKPAFLASDAQSIVSMAREVDAPISQALMKVTTGVGPVIYREIAYRAFGDVEPQGAKMNDVQAAKLQECVLEIQREHASGGVPTTIETDEGEGVEFSFTALTQYTVGTKTKTFSTYSELLESYYFEKDRTQRLHQQGKSLAKQVNNLYERAQRRQAARKQELLESEGCEDLRVQGELVSANLHLIQRGQSSVTVMNYYTGEEQLIPLDVRLTPAGNAQKYFKNYKRKITAAKMLATLLEQGEQEIEYLASVRYVLEQASTKAQLDEIYSELVAGGYIRARKSRQRQKQAKAEPFLRYRASTGHLILVGRGNVQNDALTMKTARGKDVWLHVKDAPGSHTVVMSGGQDVPIQALNEAAHVAVKHSSLNGGAKVAVDYTPVRNVKKPPGAKPGMVIYDPYETAFITLDEQLVQTLAENEVRFAQDEKEL